MPVRLGLLFLGSRNRKIAIPNAGHDLPPAVGLLFPNLDVFAAVIHRLAAGIVHGQLIRATHSERSQCGG